MSPLPPRPRFKREAGRAAFGLWLILMSLFAAPQLNSWLDRQYPGHPAFLLLGAVGLAIVACTGLTLVITAILRTLTALVASAGQAASPTASPTTHG